MMIDDDVLSFIRFTGLHITHMVTKRVRYSKTRPVLFERIFDDPPPPPARVGVARRRRASRAASPRAPRVSRVAVATWVMAVMAPPCPLSLPRVRRDARRVCGYKTFSTVK